MKNIVIYYSFGGTCRNEAARIAKEQGGAVLCEVKETKKRSILSAFFNGCPKAMRRKASLIEDLPFQLEDFERIVIIAPIWAGYPAPAFNAIVSLLPQGKEVEVFLCSGGGEAPKSKIGTMELIEQKKCRLIAYHDIKASTNNES